MVPILEEDVGKIEGARVIPVEIVVQSSFDKKVNTKIKRRVTHDCIREGPSQQSINRRFV